MTKIVLITIFLSLIVGSSQPAGGCTRAADYATLADAWSAAQTTRCLEIPAGTYTVQPGQLQSSVDNFSVHGAGMGQTILQLPDGLVVPALSFVVRLTGARQSVSDLTIRGGVGTSGPGQIHGVSIYTPAMGTHINGVEVTSLYGGNAAGGSGIDLYQPWNVGGGYQSATIEDCYIHDGPNMSGIVVNSNGNVIRNNRILDMGNTVFRHGMYIQGGYNTFEGNTIERSGGYNLHAWQKVQSIDGSGNIFRGNTSVDPGFQHMIVSGLMSNGTNPAIPSGRPLTRHVTITGNTFRNTLSLKRTGLLTDVPALIVDNTFEDVVQDGAQTIRVTSLAAGSIVRGNAIRAMAPAVSNGGAISIESASLCEGNSIDTRGFNYAISGGVAGAIIGPNLIYRST